MKVGLIALAILVAASLAGAESRPHLAPFDRDFTIFAPYPGMHAYKLAVRDALLGHSSRHCCEAIVIPSFEREWAVHLRDRDGEYEVVCTVMQRQLWVEMYRAAERPDGSARSGDEVPALARLPKDTWRWSAPVSRTTAELMQQVWSAMLARAQDPPEPPRCLDGTSYYIFQRREGRTSGGIGRCPQSDTPAADLLAILKDLRKASGSSGQDLMRQDMALARKMTLLLRKLR